MGHRLGRRQFLQSAAFAGFGIRVVQSPAFGAVASQSPNERLRFACIGVGGKGRSDSEHVASLGEIVALCDIDAQRLGQKAQQHPNAKTYSDFRKLLEELAPKIDAVTVSTADHTHAVAGVMAMKLGKPVYCQKPLTHTPYEARVMRETAAKMKLPTQMGNQGTSHPGFRDGVELIRSGVIGPIKEVHVWTNRPFKYWKQAPDIVARPEEMPVPAHVSWDTWLGPAPFRPYNKVYHPHDWRGWWDFGTGALGDMGCHTANLAFKALKLGLPTRVSATSSEVNAETCPAWSTIVYEFPARGDLPPVKLTWYEGAKDGKRNLPSPELLYGEEPPSSGSILVGEKGSIFSPSDYGSEQVLLPRDKFPSKKSLSPQEEKDRGKDLDLNHKAEWVRAIRENKPELPGSNFSYGATLTEAMLLGNVAVRLGKPIEYDGATGRVTNEPDAERFLRFDYRSGWSL
ncbi:MAG: Gfo/Idh/MocA family oxidoreductase [Isosphaeraceae bacterium]